MQPTYSKRSVKKRGPVEEAVEKVKAVGKDIGEGFGELKRQMGTAVSTVKRGYQRVRSFMR